MIKKFIFVIFVFSIMLFAACAEDNGTGIMPTLIVSTPECTDPIDVTPFVPSDSSPTAQSSGEATSFPSQTGEPDETATPTATATADVTAEATDTITATATATATPAGHACSFGEWRVVVDSTEIYTGIRERECSVCGVKQSEEIPVKSLSVTEKLKLADKVAEGIAASIPLGGSELVRVTQAAQIIFDYCSSCTLTVEGTDHDTAYGVLVKGEYSNGGAVRALGLVLDHMGIKWEHVNLNTSMHQWCSVKMDGQSGYADGYMGLANYGKHPLG